MKLRLADCELELGYTAVAAMTAVLLTDREGRLIACLAAAMLHELGHLAMMKRLGVRIRAVRVRLFDVLIEADACASFRSDVLVTLAGPAVNLCLAALLRRFSPEFALPQLVLGLFNLTPVMSFDGGRLLYLLLARRYAPATCDAVLRITTFVFLLPLMTAGLVILFNNGYNYSFLAISLYLAALLLFRK